jgi:hypothetical protein
MRVDHVDNRLISLQSKCHREYYAGYVSNVTWWQHVLNDSSPVYKVASMFCYSSY